MSLVKLVSVLGIASLVCFIGSNVYWDGKQKESANKIMSAYIETHKSQILDQKSTDSLACNKQECLANFSSLKSENLLTEKDERFFKEGQYYIFNKKEDGTIAYRIIKSKDEVKADSDALSLAAVLTIM